MKRVINFCEQFNVMNLPPCKIKCCEKILGFIILTRYTVLSLSVVSAVLLVVAGNFFARENNFSSLFRNNYALNTIVLE